MVQGIEIFRKHFEGYEDKYVLIGGTACDLLFQENGLLFRATKDLDIILIAEALTPEFGQRFWEFIQLGKYGIRQRSDGRPIFYRFQKPLDIRYPAMLELFSRNGDALGHEDDEAVFTRIPLGDEISSLSAILLDDAYYNILSEGTIQIDGVSLLSDAYLLLFKAKAWLDLSRRRELGEAADSRDIRKHKNDAARLATLISPTLKVDLAGEVKDDIAKFVEAYEREPVDPKALGFSGFTHADILERLKICYQI
jgi:hypothetical protein